MKYLLKNGTVISGAGTRKQDVLVEGEKIIKSRRGAFTARCQGGGCIR